MKSQTLHEIYKQAQNFYTNLKCFRVRDTETLMDYLICHGDRWKWGYDSVPKEMRCLLLEAPFSNYYIVSCFDPIYTLLSDKKELDFFGGFGERVAIEATKKGYSNAEENR